MKWLIASDLHGSAYYCEKLMRAIENENPDRLLLLGDELYHGPRNDLPVDYNTKAVMAMLNSKKEMITAVRGNCDAEVDQWVLEFPMMDDSVLIDMDGIRVFATHGHIYNEENLTKETDWQVLLCGHTHVPACEAHESYTYMNPGSVSIPKNGSHYGYMTAENGTFCWKDLEGKVMKTVTL